jgi:hypothetical protein
LLEVAALEMFAPREISAAAIKTVFLVWFIAFS